MRLPYREHAVPIPSTLNYSSIWQTDREGVHRLSAAAAAGKTWVAFFLYISLYFLVFYNKHRYYAPNDRKSNNQS